jgi:hypothetical protein
LFSLLGGVLEFHRSEACLLSLALHGVDVEGSWENVPHDLDKILKYAVSCRCVDVVMSLLASGKCDVNKAQSVVV